LWLVKVFSSQRFLSAVCYTGFWKEFSVLDYLLRFLVGGLAVVGISFLVRRGHFDLAGLLTLVPAVSLVSYIFVGHAQGESALRSLVIASLPGVPAFPVFVASLLWLLGRYGYGVSIAGALLLWAVVACGFLRFWRWWEA